MRPLTSAMQSAVSRVYTEPGAFLEITLPTSPTPTTRRYNDRGANVVWDGQTWLGGDVDVENVSVSGGLVDAMSIKLFDETQLLLVDLFSQNPIGARVRAWIFEAPALATNDPVLVFDGAIADYLPIEDRIVSISCKTLDPHLPRDFLWQRVPSYLLLPEGYELKWGSTKLKFNRRGEFV